MTNRLAVFQAEIGSGITPSMPKLRAPFFLSGRNVRFGPWGVEVTSPWFRVVNKLSPDPVRGMHAINIGSNRVLFWGTHENLYKWDGVSADATEVGSGFSGVKTGTAPVPATVWSMAGEGEIVVATDNISPPQKSVAGGAFAVYAGFEDQYVRGNIFRAVGQYLVALDVGGAVGGVDVIAWHDAFNIEDWLPTENNTAGWIQAKDATGRIVAAEHLGTTGLLFYTQGSVHILIPAGGTRVFGQRKILSNVGAASKQAVVPVRQQHFVFDQEGIYVTDGREVKYIDDAAVRKFIYGNLDYDRISHVHGWHNQAHTEVQWFYPTKNLGMEGVGFNYVNNAWSLFPFELTSALPAGVFKAPIAGNSFGSIFETDPNFLGGGVNMTGTHLETAAVARLKTGYGTFGYGTVGYGGRNIPDG